MFKVAVRKSIWTQEESVVDQYLKRKNYNLDDDVRNPKVAILIKEISLPFAPFIGLEINIDNWLSGPLKTVTWYNVKQYFYCTVEDEFPHELFDVVNPYVAYEDLLKWSLESGWERPTQGGGDAPFLKTNG